MSDLAQQLVGLKAAELLGAYFRAKDGGIEGPDVLAFRGRAGDLIALEADDFGGMRQSPALLECLYFDPDIGFAFVAPLLMSFAGELNGAERIESVSVDLAENLTVVRAGLDVGRAIVFRFEDDEMRVLLDVL